MKGALVRSGFLQLKDMDAPSSFFLIWKKGEMRSHTLELYAELFTAEHCEMKCREELLGGLPQFTLDEKAALDAELTL